MKRLHNKTLQFITKFNKQLIYIACYKSDKIMEDKKLQCESCKWYRHSPNILGGIAECLKEVKYLNTFWANDACEKHEKTKQDNLKEQNDFYKEHLGGAIQLNKNK